MPELEIRPATEDDLPLILSLVKELAEYERLSHQVVANEEVLRGSLFGERRVAEVLIGHHGGEPAGFALFFHNFSTFLGRPGIYLEDLYVRPRYRGMGYGKALLAVLRSWPESAAAGGSNGGFWTGTSPR
jgi:GNAT superfamily N-acetyltransferase